MTMFFYTNYNLYIYFFLYNKKCRHQRDVFIEYVQYEHALWSIDSYAAKVLDKFIDRLTRPDYLCWSMTPYFDVCKATAVKQKKN